jgi:hypothetical protein
MSLVDAAEAAEHFTIMMRSPRRPLVHVGLAKHDPAIGLQRPHGKPVLDGLSGPGAHILADRIRDLWKQQGHEIFLMIEPVPNTKASFQIRSNLINGLPPCSTNLNSAES